MPDANANADMADTPADEADLPERAKANPATEGKLDAAD